MKKTIRKILLALLVSISTVFCLTSCSNAHISTSVYVDDNFAGRKDIKIDLSDVGGYINGGVGAVEQSIWNHQPEGTDYYIEEGSSVVVFSYYFSNLDEYRTKVANALKAGGEFDDEVSVIYENSDTIFKKGIIYKENFDTRDLIAWFKNGLIADGVIEESNSSNITADTPKVFINDTEIENYSSSISIDEQERTCFSSINAYTQIIENGTYARNLTFYIDNSTKETIDQETDLSQYMMSLYIPNTELSEKVNIHESDSGVVYDFYITGETFDELIEKTNSILQSNNSLSIELALNEENVGHANINLKEKLDGSFYLSTNGGGATVSDVIPYKNIAEVKEYKGSGIDSDNYSLENGMFTVKANPGVEYTAVLDWLISPSNVLMEVKANTNGKEKIILEEVFPNSLDSSFVDSAENRLNEFMNFGGTKSRNDNTIEIKFEGEQLFVEKQITNFSNGAETEENNFKVTLTKGESGKIWQDATRMIINFDFSKVFGEGTMIVYKEKDGLLSSQKVIGDVVGSTGNSTLEVVELKVSIIGYVLGIGGLATLIGGIALIVLGRKDFKNIKFEKKPKPIKPVAPQPQNTPKKAPVQAPKAPKQSSNDEEDLL